MYISNPFSNPCYSFRSNLEYRKYEASNKVMALVNDTILKESEHELLLDYLVSSAPTPTLKSIISAIRHNKKKHTKTLKKLYTFYNGENMPSLSNISFEAPISYAGGIRMAKAYELSEFKRYKDIGAAIQDNYFRAIVHQIINDKLKNLQAYNYISYQNYKSSSSAQEPDNNTIGFSSETEIISRETKEFKVSELENYNGSWGKPAYVAVNGIVYDVSNEATWGGASHFGLIAGKDLSSQFQGCHGNESILTKLPKVGILKK